MLRFTVAQSKPFWHGALPRRERAVVKKVFSRPVRSGGYVGQEGGELPVTSRWVPVLEGLSGGAQRARDDPLALHRLSRGILRADFCSAICSRLGWPSAGDPMILEAISTLLAAITIVFSRLDRRHDAVMTAPDLRTGLLQLDELLEDWLVAAKATNEAAATWLPKSGDELIWRLNLQGGLASSVLERVQSPLDAQDDVPPVSRDTGALRRLFEIYAPAESAHVAEWAKDRYDLVDQMLRDLSQARQMGASTGEILGRRGSRSLTITSSMLKLRSENSSEALSRRP